MRGSGPQGFHPRWRGVLALAVFSTIALSAAVAQDRQERQRPSFRAEVSAVLVDVLVLDNQGRPVRDLTADDFEITEDGVAQRIASFDVIDWTSYVNREAPRSETASPTEAASVNAFPRRFIFVLNRQGADFAFLRRAKRAIETFVVEAMAEGDEAMVIDIALSTRIVQPFDASKEKTLESIRKMGLMPQSVRTSGELTTRDIYETMRDLGRALADFQGRKIVLFFSMELNQSPSLLVDLERAVNALNQSNTSVYAVDIKDVISGTRVSPFRTNDLDGSRLEAGGLFPLANETGGRYFYNLTTFEPAVRRVGQENSRYYLLSYVPTNMNMDGRYRRIDVRVKRPDVEVVARRGYFARQGPSEPVTEAHEGSSTRPPPPGKESEPSSVERSASRTNSAPADTGSSSSTPGNVELSTYLFPDGHGGADVPIAVSLPLDLVSTGEESPSPRRLELTITDRDGKVVSSSRDPVGPGQYRILKRAQLAPGLYLLRLTVEAAGKQLYQASSPIDVPKGFGERFGFSSIVPVENPNETQYAQTGAVVFRPRATLARGEDAYIFFRIMAGEVGESPVRLVYSIFRGDEEIHRTEQPEPIPLTRDLTGTPVLMRVPMSRLEPGVYRLELRLTTENGARSAVGEIDLAIHE